MNNFYGLPLVLHPQPEGGYTITCPLLPELITEVDDISQVYAHVADALAVVIELYEDMKRSLPTVCWGLLSLTDPPMRNRTEAHV